MQVPFITVDCTLSPMQKRRGKKKAKRVKKGKKKKKKKKDQNKESEEAVEGEQPEDGTDGQEDTKVQDNETQHALHNLDEEMAEEDAYDDTGNNYWTSPLMERSMIYAQSICNIVAMQAEISDQDSEKEYSHLSRSESDMSDSKFGSAPLMSMSSGYARAVKNIFERQQIAGRDAEDDSGILKYPEKPGNSDCFASSPLRVHSAVYARSIHNIMSELLSKP